MSPVRYQSDTSVGTSFNVTADRGTYEVLFDSMKNFEKHIPTADRVVCIDSKVIDLFPALKSIVGATNLLIVEAREENKSLEYVMNTVFPFFQTTGVSRSSHVVVIGGGIVQDVISFACSVYMRGIPWSLYPTTFLAQSDSCIGSKTSINYKQAKNLLGTFYPAHRVIVDKEFLQTLTDEDFLSGVGEVIKVCLLSGGQHVDWLTVNIKNLVDREPAATEEAAYRALMIKKGYIEADEYDVGVRNELNYGHGFGHALEAASNFQISHGLGVLYGMGVENLMSRERGLLSKAEYGAMQALITPYLIQVPLVKTISFEALLPYLKKDKKNEGQSLTFILSRGPGQMIKQSGVDASFAREMWHKYQDSLLQ